MSEIIVRNKNPYDKQLQIIDTYVYKLIPRNGEITLKNVDKRAIKYYEGCGFEVEKVKSGEKQLNEVPEDLREKKLKELDNLNEVGIKKPEKKEVKEEVLNEVEVERDTTALKTKLQKYDPEMLRALCLDIGYNPKNLKNKEKLIEILLEQDEQKIQNLLDGE